ncbi:hypothetical protein [Arcicella rosea]|uniref:Uncharacterized protein n=1 Tax=Arcicella rosea TaxID=502909 RepID=A0A841EYK8_9BACT|nr:hypothetical protein [Arcicella rosea]MBB6005708.1 hypothetical protein [Arcicella rosea]
MQNVNEIETQFVEAVFKVYDGIDWDTFNYDIYYMFPGTGSKINSILLKNNHGVSTPNISLLERMEIDDMIFQIDDYYLESQGSDSTRFNRITYRIFSDGRIESKYFWDTEFYIEDLLSTARNTAQWLNDRMLMLMFEGQFRKKRWDSAIFEFTVADGQVNFKGTASNKRYKSIPIDLVLPTHVCESIVYHHEVTNEGELKGRWKAWNKLVIRSPHNDIDLDKDVDYLLE